MNYTNFLQELSLFYLYNHFNITTIKTDLSYLISLQKTEWLISHKDTLQLLVNLNVIENLFKLERENNILRLKESLTDLLLQSPELQIDYLCFEVIDTTAEHLIKCFSSISASTQEEYFKQCFNKMCK